MRKIVFVLAFTAPLAAPVAVFAQDTQEADRGLIVDFLTDNLSGAGRDVQVYGFSGALSSKATIDKLTIADADGIWLTAEGLVLDWDRAALLRGRIDVTDLAATRIEVLRPPLTDPDSPAPTARTEPFSLPDLPVSVEVDKMQIATLALGEAFLGEPVSLSIDGSAKLDGGTGLANLAARRLDGATGEFLIDGSYSNQSRVLGLMLALREGDGGIVARMLDLPDLPSVDLVVEGTGPIDAYSATLTLDTDGTRRLDGAMTLNTTQVEGQEPVRSFDLDVGGDVTALFLPAYRDFFGPEVHLNASGSRGPDGTDLPELTLTTDTLNLSGSARINAAGWPQSFDLTGTMGRDDGAPLLLPISGAETYVDSADISVRFNSAAEDLWRADIAARGFTRTGLALDEAFIRGGGKIDQTSGTVSGSLSYGATGVALDDTTVSQALGDRVNGLVQFTSTAGGLTEIPTLTLYGAGLRLGVATTLDPTGEEYLVTTKGRLQAQGLGRFASLASLPGLGGAAQVAFDGTVRPLSSAADMRIDAQTTDLTIGIDQLDTLLQGDGTAALRFIRDTAGTRIENLSVTTPETTLTGDLALSEAGVSGKASLATAAANLLPGASDRLTLELDGSRGTEGDIAGMAVLTRGPDRIDLSADLPATGSGPLAFHGTLSDLSAFAGLLQRPLSGALTLSTEGVATADFTTIDLGIDATGRSLGLGIETVDKLLSGSGSLNGRLIRNGDLLTISGLDLDFPNIGAQANAETDGTNGRADYTVRLADMALFAPDFSGPLSAEGTAKLTEGVWSIDTTAQGPGGTTARVDGSLGDTLNLDITGAAPLGLLNGVLSPRRLGGQARFDLAMNGPAELSSLSGTVNVSGADLSAPTMGQSLEAINGTIRLSGGTARMDLTGASSVGGTLALRGSVGLSGGYDAALTVDANRFVLRDPTLYQTDATGTIAVSGPLRGGASIAGTVTLGTTEVQVPSSTVGSLGDLPDVVHSAADLGTRLTLERAGITTSGEDTTAATGPGYPLDLTINAPARIFVRGRGLDAELGGSLHLTGTTNQIIPAGQFSLVRGRLDILQQRFALTEGSVTMQGEFVPTLRFVASTESATGTAIDVVVEGPASAPEVSFTSSPELPQDEVLSQLLFGRDLSSISAFQAIQLAAAVGTLTGRSGGGLVDKIRMGAGLDDLDVTTSDSGSTAVRAGKYLSENIYTDVTVTADGTSEVNLNLDLGGDFTAKGGFATDGETTLGVYFERDY